MAKRVREVERMQRRQRLREFAGFVTAFVIVAGNVSCHSDGPLEPVVFVDQQLRTLWFEPYYSELRDSGLIVVMAEPVDTSYRLTGNNRLKLRITTTGGDMEELGLWSYTCGYRDCSALSIAMEDGFSVLSLQNVIFNIPARLWIVSVSGRYGGVRLFDPRALSSATESIRRNKNVKIVEQSGIGVSDSTPFPSSHLLCAAPVEFAQPHPYDGTVQTGPGQTIQFSYHQPDGSVFGATVQIP